MKISEVIEKLLSIQEKEGDIDVTIEGNYREFNKIESIQSVHWEDSEENFVIIE